MCITSQLHSLSSYYIAVMNKNIKNKDRVRKRFWSLFGKSYKWRTVKKKKKVLPYVLIEHMKDLLGASYTN